MVEMIGTTLGKYHLVARLGGGGMGTVFKAHQPRLERYVAIKVLHTHLAQDVEFVSRFEREAAAIARLSHPNIVKIYDFDAEDGQYYMVMEYLQGPTLKAELSNRQQNHQPLNFVEAVQIILPLLKAVGYAHANGVVHRDIKPSNVILTSEGQIVLTDFGLAYIVGGLQLTDTGSTSGTPEYMSPEQAKGQRGDERSDLYSLGVMLYEMATGRLPFQGETRFATVLKHIQEEPQPPSQLNAELPSALEGVILTALQKDAAERFQTAEEMYTALEQALGSSYRAAEPLAVTAPLAEMDAIGESTVGEHTSTSQRPYRGLFAFREEDAAFFFGRQVFTDHLFEAIQRQNMVVVVGPSGSGKSSVIFAGLAPRLRQETHWLIVDFRPGSQPFQALANALLPLLEPEISEVGRMMETARLAEALEANTLSLKGVAQRIVEKQVGVERLLLVGDQFEELFTLTMEPGVRQHFIQVLLQAVGPLSEPRQQPGPLALALTLRADFMGQALADRALADALQAADVKLGPMTRAELTEAIERPAQQLGVTFEHGLVERILDDLGDEPGNLPLLEFALTLLWDRRAGRRLTHAAYDSIGRVGGALARYAEKVYARMGDDEKLLARRVFTQMVRPGKNTEDTRRVATRAELGEEGWTLAQRLADERLVITGQDAAGNESAEVIHEVLIRGWQRLQEWMGADREFRDWQERLRAGMRQWESGKYDDSVLLRGALLGEAEEWMAARQADMNTQERQFIQNSVALREKENAEREAQRQRELEAAQKLASEQQQRAEEQAAAAQKLRSRAWLLAGALVIALLAAVLALNFARQSTENARLAEQNALRAEQNAQQAEQNANRAEQNAQQAEANARQSQQNATVALARQLAAQSTMLVDNQLDLALLLSVEATNLYVSAETRSSLLTALQYEPNLVTFVRGFPSSIQHVAFNPDGSQMAVVGANGEIRMWQVDYPVGGAPSFRLQDAKFEGHDTAQLVNTAGFSMDGKLLATGSDDTTLRIWDAASGELMHTFQNSAGVTSTTGLVQTLDFSPDGKWLASGGGLGMIELRDAHTWELAGVMQASEARDVLMEVRFSPDGSLLAACSADGQVTLFDVQSRTSRFAPQVYGYGISGGVSFNPSGKRLVFISYNEEAAPSLNVMDVASGEVQLNVLPLKQRAAYVIFTAEDEIAVRYESGNIERWNISSGEMVGEAFDGDVNLLIKLVTNPDGRLLASGSGYGVVEIWSLAGDLRLGQELPSLHTDYVLDAQIRPDGKQATTVGFDGQIVTYDLEKRTVITPTLWHSMPELMSVTGLALDPQYDYLLVGRRDGSLSYWDLSKDEQHSVANSLPPGDSCLAIVPGERYAAGSVAGSILDGRDTGIYGVHEAPVTALALDPTSAKFLDGDTQGRMVLWGLSSIGMTMEYIDIQAHSSGISSLAISPNGRWAASGSEDGELSLWSLSGEGARQLNFSGAHQGTVLGLYFTQAQSDLTLYSVGTDGRALRWDLRQEGDALASVGEPVTLLEVGAEPALHSAAWFEGLLVLGDEQGGVRAWNLSAAAPVLLLQEVLPAAAPVTAVAVDGKRIVAGGGGDALRLWPLEDGRAATETAQDLVQKRPSPIPMRVFAYSPDGKWMATGGANGTFIVWDVAARQPLYAPVEAYPYPIFSLAFSTDSQRLAVNSCSKQAPNLGCVAGEVSLWEAASGKLLARQEVYVRASPALAFSPDGKWLAVAGCGVQEVSGNCVKGEVKLLDALTLEAADLPFEGHTREVKGVAFSPDSRQLATISITEAFLWDVSSGKTVGKRMNDPINTLYSVEFSPDGVVLAMGGINAFLPDPETPRQGVVQLWDAEEGIKLGQSFSGHKRSVYGLGFSPDGRWLLSGSLDGVVMLWTLDMADWRVRACRIANRNLTQQEWEQFFGDQPYRATCGDIR